MNGVREDSSVLLDVLVADAVLPRADAEALRTRLREAWVPLGKILRQQGKLSMSQLLDALQAQQEAPGRLLGELCVSRGYCTVADVVEALRLQREVSPHVIEVLVKEGACDLQKLCLSLARYVRDLEGRAAAAQAR